MSAIIAIIKY